MKKIFFINEEKDQELLLRALANSNVIYFDYEFARLESGETLLNHLCQIVAESFSEAQSLGIVSTHREVKEGSYRSLISSLVFYKWNLKKAGLLDLWADLGCGLARRQLFTNGNKRTALLTVRNFVYECGYRLLDTGFSGSWEKLLINVATAKSEEVARELFKEKIWSEISL